ncbi:hypothetical protein WG66_017143 [Moniliophthora roreri]|uniref:Uncharacterized protein n=1 Tax=Moniliophthora roreri TaxID=221103 RepID=A0A0W0G238_MONRR|nr:hypothetical protein WG66_017143 [Moniliophthora roreri]
MDKEKIGSTHVPNTNYATSGLEVEQISDLLMNPEEELRIINEELLRLQARRDYLQKFVNEHRALKSPFRRLPRDIHPFRNIPPLSSIRPPSRTKSQ